MLLLIIHAQQLKDSGRKAYIHADLEKELIRLLVWDVCNERGHEPGCANIATLHKTSWG